YRWSKGHWYVAFTNFFNLFKLTFVERKWKYVDQLLYLFSMGRALQVCIIFINIFLLSLLKENYHPEIGNISTAIKDLTVTNMSFADSVSAQFSSINWIRVITNINIVTLISICYGMLILPIYGAWMDKGIFLNPFRVFFSGLYFGLSFVFVQFLALFRWKKQHKWVVTPHNKIKEEHK
ncbi:MAG: O54 family O-antigen polysaccharide synthase WbbF, partial [Citrobacter portucalensis]